MGSDFDSFNESEHGVYSESAHGVRGGGVLASLLCVFGTFTADNDSNTILRAGQLFEGSFLQIGGGMTGDTSDSTVFGEKLVVCQALGKRLLEYNVGPETWDVFANEILDVVLFNTVEVYQDNLYVGGDFQGDGETFFATHFAYWDGAWNDPDGGTQNDVLALTKHGSDLVVVGDFITAGSGGTQVTSPHAALWNGSVFTAMDQGLSPNLSSGTGVISYQGDIYVGGNFTGIVGGGSVNGLARFNVASDTWSSVGTSPNDGTNAFIRAFVAFDPFGNGEELIIGGTFTVAGGVANSKVVSWDGTNYNTMGDGFNDEVKALWVLDGTLYAAGFFTLTGATTLRRIAKWVKSSSSWVEVDTGLNGAATSLIDFEDLVS